MLRQCARCPIPHAGDRGRSVLGGGGGEPGRSRPRPVCSRCRRRASPWTSSRPRTPSAEPMRNTRSRSPPRRGSRSMTSPLPKVCTRKGMPSPGWWHRDRAHRCRPQGLHPRRPRPHRSAHVPSPLSPTAAPNLEAPRQPGHPACGGRLGLRFEHVCTRRASLTAVC